MSKRPSKRRGVDVFDLRVADEALVVVSLPTDRRTLHGLTTAEQEIALAVVAGHSSSAIAKQRGRSERTIANQLAAIYRKLGVSSRAELAARLARDGDPPSPAR